MFDRELLLDILDRYMYEPLDEISVKSILKDLEIFKKEHPGNYHLTLLTPYETGLKVEIKFDNPHEAMMWYLKYGDSVR